MDETILLKLAYINIKKLKKRKMKKETNCTQEDFNFAELEQEARNFLTPEGIQEMRNNIVECNKKNKAHSIKMHSITILVLILLGVGLNLSFLLIPAILVIGGLTILFFKIKRKKFVNNLIIEMLTEDLKYV